jgi:phosphoglycolate phosphatase
MSHYQGILFDLDGTLVNSATDICTAVNHVLTQCALPELEENAVERMIGDGIPKLAERALAAAGGDMSTLASFTRDVSNYYQLHAADHTKCFPGVLSTLKHLHNRGIRMGVVTNKPVAATSMILDTLGLSEFMDVVIGGDSLPVRKPNPAPVIEAIRHLGVSTERVIMVGDSAHDIDAASGAGIASVAVTYGYHRAPPATFNASYLIDHFPDLLSEVFQTFSVVNANKDQ